MNCSIHSEKPANGACMYCGKLYCSDCLIEVNGKMYCKADLSKILNEAKESAKANAGPNVFMNSGGSSSSTSSHPNSNSSYNSNPTNVVPTKSKVTAGLLGIFLGGLGIHKFYLGKASGIWYILFCWTFVPVLIGFIEGIIYFTMSDYEFAMKYGARPA